MGRFVFKLPDVGEGIAEAEVVGWQLRSAPRLPRMTRWSTS